MPVDCLQPTPFGVDTFGDLHHLKTVKTHTAFYGITRKAGKTSAAMGFILYNLLDPKARLVVIDGKNDESDWQILGDIADDYVGGCTTASIDAVKRLLLKLTEINESRASGDKGVTSPIFIVVDEWKMIRGAAKLFDKVSGSKTLDEIDGLMANLATSCAGRFMHLVFTPQRGTVEFLPGDLGGNIGQRVQGCAAHKGEVGYSIHCIPEIYPSKVGEFLVSSDDGGTAVLVSTPELTPAHRLEVVAAIRKVRAAVALPAEPVDMVKHVAEPAPDREPTWQEMVAVVLDVEGRAMLTSEIHAALPESSRPTATPERFGRYLTADAASDEPTVTRGLTSSGSRGWVLAEGAVPASGGYEVPFSRSNVSEPHLLTGATA